MPGDNQISSIDQVMYLDSALPLPTLSDSVSRAMLSAPPLLNRVITYNYDGLNRLTGALYQDNGSNHYQYSYTYDLNSNRLTSLGQNFFTPLHSTFDSTTYTYSTDNQVSTAIDQNGTTTFQYFADGTLGSQVYQAVNSGSSSYTISYGYDAADRLNLVHNNLLNQTFKYVYDGMDHRVQQQIISGSQTVVTNYLVDPTGSLPQVLAEYPNSTAPTYYIPAGMLIGQDQGGNGGLSYFATDGLGSVRSLLTSTGTTAGLANFDPYGKILPDPGAPGTGSHLGYTGALTDSNGLVYLNARYYNPADGSFLSADPMAGRPNDPGSFNLYAYVKDNPINFIDWTGKDDEAAAAPLAVVLCASDPVACIAVAVLLTVVVVNSSQHGGQAFTFTFGPLPPRPPPIVSTLQEATPSINGIPLATATTGAPQGIPLSNATPGIQATAIALPTAPNIVFAEAGVDSQSGELVGDLTSLNSNKDVQKLSKELGVDLEELKQGDFNAKDKIYVRRDANGNVTGVYVARFGVQKVTINGQKYLPVETLWLPGESTF